MLHILLKCTEKYNLRMLRCSRCRTSAVDPRAYNNQLGYRHAGQSHAPLAPFEGIVFQAVDVLPSGSKPPLAAPTAGARTPSPGVQLPSVPLSIELTCITS